MRVLVACEFSGIVREAFRKRGHDAWSCDLLPTNSNPEYHYQTDIATVLNMNWDLVIAHPPCTYLTNTGNKWFKPEFKDRFPTRIQDREDAVEFFMQFTNCERYVIENPIGHMSTRWRKPDQIIHPYYFGDPQSKATCLWLKGVPPLIHTNHVEPKFYIYADGRRDPLWHVETMKLPPLERMKARSITFSGIADAMAEQWGNA